MTKYTLMGAATFDQTTGARRNFVLNYVSYSKLKKLLKTDLMLPNSTKFVSIKDISNKVLEQIFRIKVFRSKSVE